MGFVYLERIQEMKIIYVKEAQLKSITEFLIEKKLIFHPVVSPCGCPDFTNYLDRKYLLIFDRNILTKLIELCTNGTLKDRYLLKVIASLMFWTIFNNVNITAGLALSEYASYKNSDIEASRENNIFLESFDFYSPELWLSLATGEIQTIPKINFTKETKDYIFNIEGEHFKMHYAEMLHIMNLYFQDELSLVDKVIDFIRWNKKNLLFCCYTMVFVLLLFSNKLN